MSNSHLLEAAIAPDGLLRVKLTPAQQAVVGEFDNDVWLAEVGFKPEGNGVFAATPYYMRMMRSLFIDYADPSAGLDVTAAQRRTAKAAAAAIAKVM